MADRAAIMDRGRVLQVAPPADLYERPATRFVATFVGESNLLRGRLAAGDGGLRLETDGGAHPVDEAAARARGLGVGDSAALAIRPERVSIAAGAGARMAAVTEVVYLGSNRRYTVRLDGGPELAVRVQAGQAGDDLAGGDRVGVGWRAEHAVLVVDDAEAQP